MKNNLRLYLPILSLHLCVCVCLYSPYRISSSSLYSFIVCTPCFIRTLIVSSLSIFLFWSEASDKIHFKSKTDLEARYNNTEESWALLFKKILQFKLPPPLSNFLNAHFRLVFIALSNIKASILEVKSGGIFSSQQCRAMSIFKSPVPI